MIKALSSIGKDIRSLTFALLVYPVAVPLNAQDSTIIGFWDMTGLALSSKTRRRYTT